jgi:hypothetical protein
MSVAVNNVLYAVIVSTPRDDERFKRVEIYRNGALVAHAIGNGPADAIKSARVALYNECVPEREGSDRSWLARYNARYNASAPSLHDARNNVRRSTHG